MIRSQGYFTGEEHSLNGNMTRLSYFPPFCRYINLHEAQTPTNKETSTSLMSKTPIHTHTCVCEYIYIY